jgi:hypothetical protein
MRKITLPENTLDGFVKIKTIKRERNIVLPKQKVINLKDPILKKKGIAEKIYNPDKTNKISKKKNVDNNYESKHENEKSKDEKEKHPIEIEIKHENSENEHETTPQYTTQLDDAKSSV